MLLSVPIASVQVHELDVAAESRKTPKHIDGEIGDLSGDILGPQPLISYARYDVELTEEGLSGFGVPKLAAKAEELREMSAADNRFDLTELGEAAAAKEVEPSHLPEAFDLKPRTQSATG